MLFVGLWGLMVGVFGYGNADVSFLGEGFRIFNTGSPWNVVAGQGGVNLDGLIEKYTREHRELEEKKMRNMIRRKEERRVVEVEKVEARRAMEMEREERRR